MVIHALSSQIITMKKETMHTLNELLNTKNSWLEGCKYELKRDGRILEPGVNFFVLALEYLSAKPIPISADEGHPKGFQIVFRCPYKTILTIKDLKFFDIELMDEDEWRISLNEEGLEASENREFSEEDRRRWLSNAGLHWKDSLIKYL